MRPSTTWKTVPLNSSSSGTSPASRLAKYLVEPISRSYVKLIGRSVSVLREKPGTIVATVTSCIGRSVLAQRSVSPKRSFSRSASVAEYRRRAGSILIWHRSAIASTRWPLVSLIRSVSVRAGTTAYLSALAPTQSKVSSAMSGPPGYRPHPRADLAEEVGDALACLRAAVKAAPVQAHPPGQLVAGVDRHEEMLDVLAGAVDEDRLHIRCHRAEQRMTGREPVPGGQVKPALGRARRARVEPGHLVRARAAQKECHPDGDLQFLPLGRRHGPVRIVEIAVGHGPVPAAPGLGVSEQQVTGAAGTQQARMVEVRDVPVLGRDLCGAQLALFHGLTADPGAAPHQLRAGAACLAARCEAARLLCPRSSLVLGRSRRARHGLWRGGRRRARRGLWGWGGRTRNEPAQARRACRAGHDGTAAGTATRTPRLSASSGSGSRCPARPSSGAPARQTSYLAPHGQVSTSRSSRPSPIAEPHDAHAFR